jgi:outer membrane protein assembly factor BamB
VYVTTAVPVGLPAEQSHEPLGARPVPHRYVLMAISRQTGDVIWERTAREEMPHESSHPDNGTWASPSPLTDGEHIFAFFESRGLFAYDMNGTPIWEKDFGDKIMRQQFGEGSTPALFGERLVIVWDHQGQSFIVALDKRNGRELWRVDRDEIDSWSTPLVVEHAGRAQVVTNGMNRLRSYDLETGRLVWESQGTTMNPIPSPVAADGMVFLTSGFRGNSLKAIRLADAKGDITGTPAVVWTLERDTPYVPSPLVYDGILYVLKGNTGILSVFDAKTGKPHYALQRLDATPNVFASPVGAAGRVYIAGREGTTVVLQNGLAFEQLAANRLDDGFDASPALVDSEIYLRGNRYLYCIAEK